MISKAKIKYLRSLELKKNRSAEGVFVAEGPKVVGDLLQKMPAQLIVATEQWTHPDMMNADTEWCIVTEEELKKVSFLQHPQQVLAVFKQKTTKENILTSLLNNSLSLALDGVQDPGNLGTIIRIADWFGIDTIFCSEDTADWYNPKVVQATMGSIARVNVVYTDLTSLFKSLPPDYPIYGTLLTGENIYRQQLSSHGIIVMGNEGKGLSPAVRELVSRQLLIPPYPQDSETAESLNVAIATAVVCAEFRRQQTL